MYRAVFIGCVAAVMTATAIFMWAVSKEIEAFCELEDGYYDHS